MYDTHKELGESLAASPMIIEGLLNNVTQERAQRARGGDEHWSVVEVVCHLRDAEERALQRMQAMRDEETPHVAGYDQDAWARDRHYADDDLRQALASFLRLRAQHVAELSALTPEQWERSGEHEEQGRINIAAHTLHIVAHDCAHAAQLARQLA